MTGIKHKTDIRPNDMGKIKNEIDAATDSEDICHPPRPIRNQNERDQHDAEARDQQARYKWALESQYRQIAEENNGRFKYISPDE